MNRKEPWRLCRPARSAAVGGYTEELGEPGLIWARAVPDEARLILQIDADEDVRIGDVLMRA